MADETSPKDKWTAGLERANASDDVAAATKQALNAADVRFDHIAERINKLTQRIEMLEGAQTPSAAGT